MIQYCGVVTNCRPIETDGTTVLKHLKAESAYLSSADAIRTRLHHTLEHTTTHLHAYREISERTCVDIVLITRSFAMASDKRCVSLWTRIERVRRCRHYQNQQSAFQHFETQPPTSLIRRQRISRELHVCFLFTMLAFVMGLRMCLRTAIPVG